MCMHIHAHAHVHVRFGPVLQRALEQPPRLYIHEQLHRLHLSLTDAVLDLTASTPASLTSKQGAGWAAVRSAI